MPPEMLRIVAIVEGDGEVPAVPILLRRFGEEFNRPGRIDVVTTIRIPASRLIKGGELERAIELAARKSGDNGGIFILLDCDDDCPAKLGPQLLQRAKAARPDRPIALVLAYHEYEAWFLGSASSLAGKRGLPINLRDHPTPENPRGCKEWISDLMPPGTSYSETDDQPAFSKIFDFKLAKQSCASFDKCYREISALFEQLDPSPNITPEINL